MTDIGKKLQDWVEKTTFTTSGPERDLIKEAADTIKRLRAALRRAEDFLENEGHSFEAGMASDALGEG